MKSKLILAPAVYDRAVGGQQHNSRWKEQSRDSAINDCDERLGHDSWGVKNFGEFSMGDRNNPHAVTFAARPIQRGRNGEKGRTAFRPRPERV